MSISLCLATHNEASNLHYPLDSCIDWVDEVVIVDGQSTDKTVKIAKSYGKKVRVIETDNPPMFHINKQKTLDAAKGDWILQLDADEEVSPELKKEVINVIQMNTEELREYEVSLKEKKLFLRHQIKIQNSKLKIKNEENGKFVAFYLPRLNYFLGKFLRYGGQYPDGSIRLIKNGKAWFPCKDVHEVMEVDGSVGWLQNPILHYDSPTFERYINRNNRYINIMAKELKEQKLEKNLINFLNYVFYKPVSWFFMTTFRHKGILDGWQGIVFSFYSALRFSKSYLKYIK